MEREREKKKMDSPTNLHFIQFEGKERKCFFAESLIMGGECLEAVLGIYHW